MKVHRIITTIEVENDNSITSVELINIHPTNDDIPLAVTNITTNGNADDIKQVYDVISERRLVIASKLKGIARYIDKSLDDYESNTITDDNTITKTNYDIPLAITDITTNGNADDIEQVYDSVNKSRLGIAGKLKSIANYIDKKLDDYKSDTITDDNTITETNDDLLL